MPPPPTPPCRWNLEIQSKGCKWQIRARQFVAEKHNTYPRVNIGELRSQPFQSSYTRGKIRSLWVILGTNADKKRKLYRTAMSKKEKKKKSPFAYLVLYPVTVQHPVPSVNTTNMFVVLCMITKLYTIFMFITEVTICWQMVHICQYVYILFISSDHCCQVYSSPDRVLPCFIQLS